MPVFNHAAARHALAAASLAAAALALPSLALAGPQFVDESGYAVSGYDVVAYWDLEQQPVNAENDVPELPAHATPGKPEFTTEWNGAKWAFSSAENRDKFVADPERYAPQFDGHCAYGVAQGGKVWSNPHVWRIVDDKLYLNVKDTVAGLWEKDIDGFVTKANSNWSKLESAPAKTGNAPNFQAEFPPQD